jgi:hypothetical protein
MSLMPENNHARKKVQHFGSTRLSRRVGEERGSLPKKKEKSVVSGSHASFLGAGEKYCLKVATCSARS